MNSGELSPIFQLAMDIIPIPGSAVPCERVFSSAKETMMPRRNRISPELMEALQVLKFLLKHGTSILNFTSGENWVEEEKNLMELVVEKGIVPEDIREFEQLGFQLNGMLKVLKNMPKGSKRQSSSKK